MWPHKTKASLPYKNLVALNRTCGDTFSMLRKLAWLLTFILATFCWVVVIEHGPDSFIVGSKIELENFKSLLFRLVQTPGK
jgi:hypothetical protein